MIRNNLFKKNENTEWIIKYKYFKFAVIFYAKLNKNNICNKKNLLLNESLKTIKQFEINIHKLKSIMNIININIDISDEISLNIILKAKELKIWKWNKTDQDIDEIISEILTKKYNFTYFQAFENLKEYGYLMSNKFNYTGIYLFKKRYNACDIIIKFETDENDETTFSTKNYIYKNVKFINRYCTCGGYKLICKISKYQNIIITLIPFQFVKLQKYFTHSGSHHSHLLPYDKQNNTDFFTFNTPFGGYLFTKNKYCLYKQILYQCKTFPQQIMKIILYFVCNCNNLKINDEFIENNCDIFKKIFYKTSVNYNEQIEKSQSQELNKQILLFGITI